MRRTSCSTPPSATTHSFFQNLDRVVQNEPWLERDRAMIDQLRTLGIEKGKPFNPERRRRRGSMPRRSEAKAYARGGDTTPACRRSIRGAAGRCRGTADLVKAAQSGYADPDALSDRQRAAWPTPTPSSASSGWVPAQFYLIAIKDKDGQAFDGGKTYRLTVPANAPVEQYWSVTAYDRETHALIRNMPRASRSSQISELQKNADGSIDIYFGPQAPAGKEANWVPTDPARKFELMFRLYAPNQGAVRQDMGAAGHRADCALRHRREGTAVRLARQAGWGTRCRE